MNTPKVEPLPPPVQPTVVTRTLITQKHKPSPLRQLFGHPMLYLSVLLHTAFLLAPLFPKETPLEPKPEEQKPKEEKVSLTALLPVARPPAPKPPAKPAVPKVAIVRPPTALPALTPPPPPIAPTPVPQPSSQASPQATPEPTPAATPPTTLDATPPPFDPSAAQQQFLAAGGTVSLGFCPDPAFFSGQIIGYFFADPNNPASAPVPGILKIDWKNTPPDKAFSELQAATAGQQLQLTQAGEFGESPLYELKDPQGRSILFLSIVPAKGAATAMLVTWNGNPNSLAPGTAALTRQQVCQEQAL